MVSSIEWELLSYIYTSDTSVILAKTILSLILPTVSYLSFAKSFETFV